jgi:hypothetical protein
MSPIPGLGRVYAVTIAVLAAIALLIWFVLHAPFAD